MPDVRFVGVVLLLHCLDCGFDTTSQEEFVRHLIDNPTHIFSQRIIRDDSSEYKFPDNAVDPGE